MDTQLKKGALEICVLSILNNREYYGYELISELSKHIKISEGTVYPILRKLSLENYLESYLMESSDGPVRKYYRITDNGKQRLKELYEEWIKFCENINSIIDNGGDFY